MPVETFGFVNALDASLPGATDGPSQGDDHIRGIKATLKDQFPNLTAAVTVTAAQLNQLDGSGTIQVGNGTSGAPSLAVGVSTVGFYNAGSGALTIAGGCVLRGNGAIPVGMVADFPFATAPTGWLRCNGQAVSRTTFADLFALLGTAYGVGDGSTTFNVPNYEQSGGLFTRATSGSPGVVQADAIKTHASTVAGTTDAHGHAHTFSTGNVNIPTPFTKTGVAPGASAFGGSFWFSVGDDIVANPGISGAITNNSGIGLSGVASYSGDTETRPVNMSVVKFIKA